jgi:ribosomal protein S18 acetylase RimI-like enzyme
MVATQPLPALPPISISTYTPIPASRYNFDELAAIYNQTRVDYIVPMPMNGKRMEMYVKSYDVDLDASVVAFDHEGQMAGIGMLGVRDDRAWITRVGVLPERRGHNLGLFLLEVLLQRAYERRTRLVQLEVIKGNIPAHRLFLKLGFRQTRELLVVRRPPGKPQVDVPSDGLIITQLNAAEIEACLAERGSGASWLDETTSLLKAGSLKGIRIEFASGEVGWAVYQGSALQLAYIVLHTPTAVRDEMTLALLHAIHVRHPMQDTKVENMAALDLRWPIYQNMGYVEAFRRIEMFKYL